jgi:hypothetical protein
MKSPKRLLIQMLALGALVVNPSGITSLLAQGDSTATAPEPIPNKAKGGSQKFMLAGKASTMWQSTQVAGSPSVNSFNPIGLMLMPLVKLNDRLFLDAQIEVDANATGGGASVNLNELIIYYRATPTLNIFAGNFSPKYGMYMGVLDDFTNRYCTNPVGMVHGPSVQTGMGIQGGVQSGYSKINYQLYIANGPQLSVDTTGATNGQLSYGNYTDNNKDKCVGGSLGWLPFSNSSLQVDLSGQYTAKTGDAGTLFENVSSTSYAADLNYYHVFNPIMVRVLAEYNATQTQNYDLYRDAAKTSLVPGFDNKLNGWFVGATLKASGAKSQVLSNFELGGRVGAYTPPKDAMWGGTPVNQTTICLTYWFTWKTPLNLAYDIFTQAGQPTMTQVVARSVFFF